VHHATSTHALSQPRMPSPQCPSPQCELLHPIVYDTLDICSLYSSNKLTKLSVAQLRLTCSYYNVDIEEQQSKRKAPYITFISDLVGSCSCTKALRVLAMFSEYKVSSDNVIFPICYNLLSYKLVLMFFRSELFHLLYRLFCSDTIYFKQEP